MIKYSGKKIKKIKSAACEYNTDIKNKTVKMKYKYRHEKQ